MLNSSQPSVSVLIPAFNAACYIAEAIGSALDQTWPTEVVVVDDGSEDETPDICRAFEPRIVFVRQPHRGVAAARNHALRLAAGDLIAFVDADDRLHPSKVERQAACLAAAPPDVGLVFTDSFVFDTRGLHPTTVYAGRTVSTDDAYVRLLRYNFVFSASVMVRRTVYETIGGYDESLWMSEDYDFFLRAARHFRLAYLDEPLYFWRQRSHSLAQGADPLAEQDILLHVLRREFQRWGRAHSRLRPGEAYANVYRQAARKLFARRRIAAAAAAVARGFAHDPLWLLAPERRGRWLRAVR